MGLFNKKQKTVINDPTLRIAVMSVDKTINRKNTQVWADLESGTIRKGNTLVFTHRDTLESFERVVLGLIGSDTNPKEEITWQDNQADMQLNMCAIEVGYIDVAGLYVDYSLPQEEIMVILEKRDKEALEKGSIFSVSNKI